MLMACMGKHERSKSSPPPPPPLACATTCVLRCIAPVGSSRLKNKASNLAAYVAEHGQDSIGVSARDSNRCLPMYMHVNRTLQSRTTGEQDITHALCSTFLPAPCGIPHLHCLHLARLNAQLGALISLLHYVLLHYVLVHAHMVEIWSGSYSTALNTLAGEHP